MLLICRFEVNGLTASIQGFSYICVLAVDLTLPTNKLPTVGKPKQRLKKT